MAIIITNIINHISGKLGKTVIRHRYGHYILYSKLEIWKISYSEIQLKIVQNSGRPLNSPAFLIQYRELQEYGNPQKLKGQILFKKLVNIMQN